MDFLHSVDFLHSAKLINMLYAFGLVTAGYILAKRISRIIKHATRNHFSQHHVMLISRGSFYLIFMVFCISSLQHLGFNLSVLLGAAGVFTVAISFAAQTAASNLISGIFLLFERPFKMGDSIEVNGISGVVNSIDLMSTKLKTADNKLIRIPNETLIKSSITNVNYFKTRRIELPVSIAYNNNIAHVKELLLTIAKNCKGVLAEPVPNVNILKFTDIAVELQFMAWVNTNGITAVKNQLQEEIKQQFEKEGIEIPSAPVAMQRT